MGPFAGCLAPTLVVVWIQVVPDAHVVGMFCAPLFEISLQLLLRLVGHSKDKFIEFLWSARIQTVRACCA